MSYMLFNTQDALFIPLSTRWLNTDVDACASYLASPCAGAKGANLIKSPFSMSCEVFLKTFRLRTGIFDGKCSLSAVVFVPLQRKIAQFLHNHRFSDFTFLLARVVEMERWLHVSCVNERAKASIQVHETKLCFFERDRTCAEIFQNGATSCITFVLRKRLWESSIH